MISHVVGAKTFDFIAIPTFGIFRIFIVNLSFLKLALGLAKGLLATVK